MGYVFISYSTAQQSEADTVRSLLTQNGIGTWMAPYSIPPGREYPDMLFEAVTNASCLLLLLTADSQASKWVKKELNVAFSADVPILPILTGPVELNNTMKLYFTDLQIHTVDLGDSRDEAVRTLLRSIAIHTGAAEPPADSALPPGTEKAERKPEQPEPCSDFGVLRKTNGDVYEGELLDGKPHGMGKYTYRSGDYFMGTFTDGHPAADGKVRKTWISGNVYEGDMTGGKLTGQGRFSWIHGDRYEGAFIDEKPNGRGRLVCRSGMIYDGVFVNGAMTEGKVTEKSGGVFEGTLTDGVYYSGVYTESTGECFEYKKGKRCRRPKK